MTDNYSEILEAIHFLENWIKTDLNELGDDKESDYAKFVLGNHKHINVAIKELSANINPTQGYAE